MQIDVDNSFNEIDSLEFVRSHPEMFLPWGRVDEISLASIVMSEIMIYGRDAHISRTDDWWIVG